MLIAGYPMTVIRAPDTHSALPPMPSLNPERRPDRERVFEGLVNRVPKDGEVAHFAAGAGMIEDG